MTQTATRAISIIARYELKRNGTATGTVVYTVKSNSTDEEYKVTFFDKKLQSCTCQGYRQWGHCYHSDALVEREKPIAETDELRFNPWHGSNYGAESYLPPLHGSKGFQLLK